MPRARTSFIWEYFTKNEDGAARCDICSRRIVVNGGSTSNLIKHLKCKHKELVQDQDGMKEEYILLEGEPSDHYEEFIEEGDDKIEIHDTSSFQEIGPPKAKKSKPQRVESDFRMKPVFFSETVRSLPMQKSIVEQKEKDDGALGIFSKYMVSLMKDMPKKTCEQTQLKIISLILEAKREDVLPSTNEPVQNNGDYPQ